MSWREIEAAFNHLFDIALDDDEARHIYDRFRRARSQLLPLFSNMVVSPYERERAVALASLRKVGGNATVKMLDELLLDDEIHDAYKLDLRDLRTLLEPERRADDEEDEEGDEDELETREAAPEGDQTDGEPVAEPADAPATESGRGRGRRRRSRGRRPAPAPESAPAVEVGAEVFGGDPSAVLDLLADAVPSVLAAFGAIPLPERLSFIDRSVRVDDERILDFLVPLLANDEWAVVQSALRAIGAIGNPKALPAVEQLAANCSRKRVMMRAERVRDQLRDAGGADAAPAAAAEPAPEPAPPAADRPQPKPKSEAERRPQPKRGPSREPAQAGAPTLGLAWPPPPPPPPPPPREPGAEPLEPPSRLPRLQVALASAVAIDGRQRLLIYRQGEDKTLARLELLIHGTNGWIDLDHRADLAADQHKLDQAQAVRAGWPLVEVTVGYLRRRLLDAKAQSEAAGLQLPRDAQAALALVGTGRKVEVAAELPDETAPLAQDDVERLLDHPLFGHWRLPLDPDGEAVQRWLGTSGKRSASRVRRRLIDEVTSAWSTHPGVAELAGPLAAQASLLERLGEGELARVAALAGAARVAEGLSSDDDRLLRELVYRGFQAAIDEVHHRRERSERYRALRWHRERHGRSAFRRGVRRR